MRKDIKASCQKRLSRIEGQVRGLSKMVDEDRYCIDIVTQISGLRFGVSRRKCCEITSRIASNTPSPAAARPTSGKRSRS
jgi:hypothetical protein